MNNLYDFLMARELGNIKDAPNKQRIGQAPLNLRSAMRYANGGGIGYPPSQIAGLTPLESRPEPLPLPEKRYPDMVAPPRPGNPDKDVPYPENLRPQQPKEPQTSYRQNADGSLVEIGYDGQPVSDYTAQQMAMHLATTGVIPSNFQYAYNGQGYDKISNTDPEKSLSPYLPTYTPPPVPKDSLPPYLPTYTPPGSDANTAFSNDLASLLNDKNSPKLSGGVGSGMPGPGTDQSLDYLIHYLATKLK